MHGAWLPPCRYAESVDCGPLPILYSCAPFIAKLINSCSFLVYVTLDVRMPCERLIGNDVKGNGPGLLLGSIVGAIHGILPQVTKSLPR
jgi:hypothetical protein